MWRVDNRELPPDITLDGGSDWIAINRNYSHYLVTDKGPFLTGLKRYYEFSLLPAEVCVCGLVAMHSCLEPDSCLLMQCAWFRRCQCLPSMFESCCPQPLTIINMFLMLNKYAAWYACKVGQLL